MELLAAHVLLIPHAHGVGQAINAKMRLWNAQGARKPSLLNAQRSRRALKRKTVLAALAVGAFGVRTPTFAANLMLMGKFVRRILQIASLALVPALMILLAILPMVLLLARPILIAILALRILVHGVQTPPSAWISIILIANAPGVNADRSVNLVPIMPLLSAPRRLVPLKLIAWTALCQAVPGVLTVRNVLSMTPLRKVSVAPRNANTA